MTRYRLYRPESRSPIGREYLHHVETSTGLVLSEVVELPTPNGAIDFEPDEAVSLMHRDKSLRKEEVDG